MKKSINMLVAIVLLAVASNAVAASEAKQPGKYKAEAMKWIKANTPLTTGNNFYFRNDGSQPRTIDTTHMGGKMEYKKVVVLKNGESIKIPTIGKSQIMHNESILLYKLGSTSDRGASYIPYINNDQTEMNLYFVITPHYVYCYDKLGNEMIVSNGVL